MDITRRSFAVGTTAVAATAALPFTSLSIKAAPAEVLTPDVIAWRVRFRDLFQTWWEAHTRLIAYDDAWDEAVDGPMVWNEFHEASMMAHSNIYYRYIDEIHRAPRDKRFHLLAVYLCYHKQYSDESLRILGLAEEQAQTFTTSPQVIRWHQLGFEFEPRGRVAKIA